MGPSNSALPTYQTSDQLKGLRRRWRGFLAALKRLRHWQRPGGGSRGESREPIAAKKHDVEVETTHASGPASDALHEETPSDDDFPSDSRQTAVPTPAPPEMTADALTPAVPDNAAPENAEPGNAVPDEAVPKISVPDEPVSDKAVPGIALSSPPPRPKRQSESDETGGPVDEEPIVRRPNKQVRRRRRNRSLPWKCPIPPIPERDGDEDEEENGHA